MDSKTFSQNYRRKLESEKKLKKNEFSELSPRGTAIFVVAAISILVVYIIVLPYVLNT